MFEIDENDTVKILKWANEHNENCPFEDPDKVGAIGGRFTYCFTPTSLGCIVVIKCACGEELNLTNIDDW